jgi:epoxyqueuosine reductase
VGCMICQNACPMNRKFRDWIEDGGAFSEGETLTLLNDEPPDKLSKSTLKKLEKLGMTEYVEVLGRNLKAVIGNQ